MVLHPAAPIFLGVLFLFNLPTHAADRTWGNSATDYNAGASWAGGNAPGSGDSALFSSAVTNQPGLTADVTNQQIRFTTATGGWTLSGASDLTLTSTGTNTGAGTGAAIVSSNTSGTNTISADIILGQGNSTTATFNQSASGGTLLISGNISSTNAITGLSLAGNTGSIITLSGNNTYVGNTTIGTGATIFNIGSANALSSGNLISIGSSTFNNTSGSALDFSTKSLRLTTGGALTFTGTNNMTFGTVDISEANRNLAVGSNTLTVGSITASGTSPTTRVLTKSGSGTLTITGAAGADFDGGFVVGGGTTLIGDKEALGGGTVELQGATLSASANLSGANALANAVRHTGSATIAGSQNLEFAGSYTLVGGSRNLTLTNSAATVISGPVYLSDAAGTGGILTIQGSGNLTISGAIANFNGSGTAGSIFNNRAGNLTLSNASNSYTGTTSTSTTAPGIIIVSKLSDGGHNSSIGASSNAATNLSLGNGGVLRYTGSGDSTDRLFTINGAGAGHTATIESSGTGALNFTNNGSLAYGTSGQTRTLILGGTNAGNNTFAPVVQNNGAGATSLTKNGTGTWALNGNNTFTGTTTVSAGTLLINGNQTTATGAVSTTASSGAILGGTGIVGGATTINTGTFLSPGASPGTLTFNGNLSLTNGSTMIFESGDLVDVNGTLDLDNNWTLQLQPGQGWTAGGSTILFTYTSLAASPDLLPTFVNNTGIAASLTLTNDGAGNIVLNGLTAIPEPSTVMALVFGIAVLAIARCRRLRPSPDELG